MIKLKTTEQFYKAIEKNELCIVYFYTLWCPDCFVMRPALPQLEKDYPNMKFYSFNRDKDTQLAKHLEIYGIPSFLLFDNGDEIGRYVDKKRKTYLEVKTFIDGVLTKE